MAKLTVPAFLANLVHEVSTRLPFFGEQFAEKDGKHITIGREIDSKIFVFLDFYGGYHRRTVGHGVGWAPCFADYVAWQDRRLNDPIQPYDGSLRRLMRLDMPRDFGYTEVHRPTSSLYLPMQVLDMDKDEPDSLQKLMVSEVEAYALPYILLMLKKRFGLCLSATQLSGASI